MNSGCRTRPRAHAYAQASTVRRTTTGRASRWRPLTGWYSLPVTGLTSVRPSGTQNSGADAFPAPKCPPHGRNSMTATGSNAPTATPVSATNCHGSRR
nr:MAG TPA: hypothetical protein [Caudoviricetes sp.]